MKLSTNDRRVLLCARKVSDEFDGLAPHGSADWTAIRRLEKLEFVVFVGTGACADGCDIEDHEGPIYAITLGGLAALESELSTPPKPTSSTGYDQRTGP